MHALAKQHGSVMISVSSGSSNVPGIFTRDSIPCMNYKMFPRLEVDTDIVRDENTGNLEKILMIRFLSLLVHILFSCFAY